MANRVSTQFFRSIDWAICKTAASPSTPFNISTSAIPIHPSRRNGPTSRCSSLGKKPSPRLASRARQIRSVPRCVKEAREAIIAGKKDWRDLMSEKVGEIKAQIIERDGQVWMIKECPLHGHYEDMMAIDSKWLSWIEKQYPGRDIPAHNDEDLHKHGSSTVRYGRGSVLTVDLTNRCNMMCDPCFMDANQVGYVHELGWDEIQGNSR